MSHAHIRNIFPNDIEDPTSHQHFIKGCSPRKGGRQKHPNGGDWHWVRLAKDKDATSVKTGLQRAMLRLSVDCSPTFVRNGTSWQHVVYNAAFKEGSHMIAEDDIPTTSHQYRGVVWWRPVSSAQMNCTSHHTRQSTNMDKSDPPLLLMWSTSLDSAKADSTSKFRCRKICPRMSVLTNFASSVDCD